MKNVELFGLIIAAMVVFFTITVTIRHDRAAFSRLETMGEIELNNDTVWYISSGEVTLRELHDLSLLADEYAIVIYSDLD